MKMESSLVNSTTARVFLKMWSNKTFVEVESFYDEQYFFTFCFIMLLFFFYRLVLKYYCQQNFFLCYTSS